jgi:hypothetical protein
MFNFNNVINGILLVVTFVKDILCFITFILSLSSNHYLTMMKRRFTWFSFLISLLIFLGYHTAAFGWSEHPMMVYPILRTMPEVTAAKDVEAKSLHRFLMEEEQGLAELLLSQELWARQHIKNYVARPEALAFNATENPEDILQRFFHAIRINPNVKMAIYLHLLPGEDPGDRDTVSPYTLTTLSKIYEMLHTTYVRIEEGELVSPIYVMATATDEPDYGFDLGLFEDNGTSWGQIYGFGNQSFGNPALEYGSQAPFHMGFYHESWLVFAAAPFLKRTYVEYRIHLYKTLAEYAFSKGQDYWGWRFLGWATHYLNDLSMPYHTSVLPAKGPLAMIWINIKAMLGFPRSRDNAVLLLSNRHTVYEHFQWIVLRDAHLSGNYNHPMLKALVNPADRIAYDNNFPRKVAARESARLARRHDRLLRRYTPGYLVSDPAYVITSSADLEGLLEWIHDAKGEEAIEG